jgi:Ca2+-transporting ATPase
MVTVWADEVASVAKSLDVDPAVGLSVQEAERRLGEAGPNSIGEHEKEGFLDVALEEIREPMILLLISVGIIYSLWGSIWDALTIFAVIVTLVLAEVFNEYRTDRTIASLMELSQPTAQVIRGGVVVEVPTPALVPGDILLLKVGERVAADGRLFESYGLEADEATLTGESMPKAKDSRNILPPDTGVGDRNDMVFAGTHVVAGKARAIVTATGMNTEVGRIAKLTEEVKEPRTPLQTAMRQLTGTLVWVAVFFSALIPALGILEGRDLRQMILTGLSLAFAVIPEELPIIVTMVLALGAFALSRRKALVKRLRAAETLGDVTSIVTDKTGTLTEGRMKLASLLSDGRLSEVGSGSLLPGQRTLLEVGLVLNDLESAPGQGSRGDPIEVAMAEAAIVAGLPYEELRAGYHLLNEYTFDTDRKMMTQVYERSGVIEVLSKGAPEAILARSTRLSVDGENTEMTDQAAAGILSAVGRMAGRALRVIAYGCKKVEVAPRSREEAEDGLTFLGLAGFEDPPRADAKGAVEACLGAGIKVYMVTGDYEATARAVADAVGITVKCGVLDGAKLDGMTEGDLDTAVRSTFVFARASPEHKLRVVEALKANGEVVAVTGDGVNDAPALKRADIGVAMGRTGTDVAKEAADMILLDDDFVTVGAAVEQGRKLFDNLRKGVRYYLACKVALVSIFLLPIFAGVPLPFAPIQIILLELFMDLAASSTFVAERAESGIMARGPRSPKTKFMDGAMKKGIAGGAVSLFLAVSVVYFFSLCLGRSALEAQTMAFGTWMICHVLLALNMRTEREPLASIGFLSNRLMVLWASAAFVSLLAAVYVPWLQGALRTTSLSGPDWALMIFASFVASFWMELKKTISFGHRRSDVSLLR